MLLPTKKANRRECHAFFFTMTVIGCPAKADVVIVMDTSSSVGNDHYRKMQLFITNLFDQSDIDEGRIRVGLVSYR